MNLLAWIVTGLIAGLLARSIVGDDRRGCLYTIAVGVIGALIGGALMNAAGHNGINEFDLRSILVAALGAIVLLLCCRPSGADAVRHAAAVDAATPLRPPTDPLDSGWGAGSRLRDADVRRASRAPGPSGAR